MENNQYVLDIIDGRHERAETWLLLVIVALVGALAVSAFASVRKK